jgi:hypothetical protein
MNLGEWSLVIGLVISVVTAIYSSMRFIVKSIMREFVPNGGNSLKDQVNRIESRLDTLISQLLEK